MITETHLTLMVADFERAINFYTQSLGFPLKQRWGDHYAMVAAPGINLGLHPAHQQFQKPEPPHWSIGFLVDDLGQYIELLETKGIMFTLSDDKSIRTAYFSDPDGTLIYFGQMKN